MFQSFVITGLPKFSIEKGLVEKVLDISQNHIGIKYYQVLAMNWQLFSNDFGSEILIETENLVTGSELKYLQICLRKQLLSIHVTIQVFELIKVSQKLLSNFESDSKLNKEEKIRFKRRECFLPITEQQERNSKLQELLNPKKFCFCPKDQPSECKFSKIFRRGSRKYKVPDLSTNHTQSNLTFRIYKGNINNFYFSKFLAAMK